MSNGNGSTAVMTTSAVHPHVAAAMDLRQQLDPVRNALGIQDLTDQEMDLFAMVAHRMRLDPFAKQIYAIKRQGKLTFQTGVDGFRSSAEETGEYRGSDEPVFGPIIDKPVPHPEWATVVVHRQLPNGEWMHQSATAYWDEFYPGDAQGFQWKRMPRVMLAKCAEAAAFRKAFPKRFGQVYVAEEMQQADAAAAATPIQATVTTQRSRVAAERARVEAQATTSAPAVPGADQGAPAAHPVTTAPAAVASEPVATTDGSEDDAVIEGQAVDVTETAEPPISAGELRDALRERLIGISAARARAKGLFGADELDRLTDAQRGALLADLDRDPPK